MEVKGQDLTRRHGWSSWEISFSVAIAEEGIRSRTISAEISRMGWKGRDYRRSWHWSGPWSAWVAGNIAILIIDNRLRVYIVYVLWYRVKVADSYNVRLTAWLWSARILMGYVVLKVSKTILLETNLQETSLLHVHGMCHFVLRSCMKKLMWKVVL